jgi:hypothetical protein
MALLRSVSEQNPVVREFMRGMEETAPFLSWFDGFYDTKWGGDVIATDAPNSARTKISRSLNEEPAFTTAAQNFSTVTKKIIYARPQIDKVLERRGGPEYIASLLAEHTYREGYMTGYELNNLFIAGDSGDDAEDFDGLLELVANANVLTAGLPIPAGGDDAKEAQQLAVEQLVQEFMLVNARHAILNDRLFPRLVTLGKNLGYYNTIQRFGEEIPRLMNTELHRAGYGPSSAEMLPLTENVGGNGNCTSIIMLTAGEKRDVTAPTTGGVMGEYIGLEGGTMYKNALDLDMCLAVQRSNALWVSKGWRLAQL